MRVPVWVDEWQFQCCGEAFGVGSVVTWKLTVDEEDFARRALGSHAPAWSAVLPVLQQVQAPGPDLGGVVVGAGGVHVFIRQDSTHAPASGQAGVRLRLLREDHHVGVPEEVPSTRGRVERVRLVRLGHELREGREGWYPRPGDAVLQDLPAAEKWPEHEVHGRQSAGFLVDLQVQAALQADLPEQGLTG